MSSNVQIQLINNEAINQSLISLPSRVDATLLEIMMPRLHGNEINSYNRPFYLDVGALVKLQVISLSANQEDDNFIPGRDY